MVVNLEEFANSKETILFEMALNLTKLKQHVNNTVNNQINIFNSSLVAVTKSNLSQEIAAPNCLHSNSTSETET